MELASNLERKKRFSIYSIPVFFLLLYACTSGLPRSIYINNAILYSTYFVSFIALLMGVKKYCHDKYYLTLFELLWILAYLDIFFNNADVSHGNFKPLFHYAFLILFVSMAKYSTEWLDSFIKWSLFFYGFYALSTIIFYFSPNLYLNQIVPLFTPEYRGQLMNWYEQGYMAGFVNHYSTNGIYLAIGSGIAFCVLFGDKKNRLKLCFAIMTTFALLLTSKRGQTIFFVISLVITYFIYNSNRPQKRFIKLLLLISLALILIFVSSMFVPEVLNAFLRLTNSADPTGGRSPLFQEAINLFLANPLFGVGWGGYKFIAKNTVGLYYPTMYAETQAHNIYLQLLSEVGIVGFSLFVFIMFWMCRNSVKLLRKCRQGIYKIGNSLERALAICLFIQVFFILYGLTGNPLYDNIMIYPYMMACAGVLSIQYKIRLIYRKRAGNLENRHFNIS